MKLVFLCLLNQYFTLYFFILEMIEDSDDDIIEGTPPFLAMKAPLTGKTNDN